MTLIAGCAPHIKVRSLSLDGADFSQYDAFRFGSEDKKKESEAQFKGIRDQYIEAAIRTELLARGMVESSDARAIVRFMVFDKEKINTRAIPTGRVGYLWGDGRLTTGLGYSHEIVATQYTEETLKIDFIDSRSEQAVWEASASTRADDLSSELFKQHIDAMVQKAFRSFPIGPGVNSAND